MTLTAGNGTGPIYHVMTAPHPRAGGFQHREKPRCGSTDLTFAYQRADLVPLSRRCAENGCLEAWPMTDAEHAFRLAVASPWGRAVIAKIASSR